MQIRLHLTRYDRLVYWTVFLLGLAAQAAPVVAAEAFVGVPRISDADTVILGGHRLRLYGGDAPDAHWDSRSAPDSAFVDTPHRS